MNLRRPIRVDGPSATSNAPRQEQCPALGGDGQTVLEGTAVAGTQTSVECRFDRREFLGLTGGACAALVLASCSASATTTRVPVGGSQVQNAERRRRRVDAAVREIAVAAGPATIDLGGRTVDTWAYDGTVPGREVRLRAGEVLRARVTNHLPEPTTVHWHGLALRNDMDGVPGLTQDPIAPGTTFTYEFDVPDPAAGATPPPDVHPAELDGRLLQLSELRADKGVTLAPKGPDRTHKVVLGGPGQEGYRWTINGKEVDKESDVLKNAKVLEVREGQRIRLVFDNQTTMFHPMHLHGHTFQVVGPGGAAGPRKDSMIVRPKERISVDLDANNPGQWLIHCHNVYHQSAGMHSVLSYVH